MEPSYGGTTNGFSGSLMSRRFLSHDPGPSMVEGPRSSRFSGRPGIYDSRRAAAKQDYSCGSSSFDGSRTPTYEIGGRTGIYDAGRTGTTYGGVRPGPYTSVGRTGLYDGGGGRTSIFDGGRTGIYEGGGRTSIFDSGRTGIFGNERNGIGVYDGGRTGTFDNGRTGIYDNERSGNDQGGVTDTCHSDTFPDCEMEANETYGVCGGTAELEKTLSTRELAYYRIIDNYIIWKLESVEPGEEAEEGKGEGTSLLVRSSSPSPSSSGHLATGNLNPFHFLSQKSIDSCIRSISGAGGGGGGDVKEKKNLVKQLEVLIEELQQKLAKHQLEVEDDSHLSEKNGESPSSISSSSGFSSSSAPSTCDSIVCRSHLKELESMKRRHNHLQQEKIHLEEQIVQLRSIKNVGHGTDSEKRVTKLEAENIHLQNQLHETLGKLRKHQQLTIVGEKGEDGEDGGVGGGGGIKWEDGEIRSEYGMVAPTSSRGRSGLQGLQSSSSVDVEARINDVVQKIKERHNLVVSDENLKNLSGKLLQQTAATTTLPPPSSSSSSSSSGEQDVRALRGLLQRRLRTTTAEARQISQEMEQTKQQVVQLENWFTGHLQLILTQIKELSSGKSRPVVVDLQPPFKVKNSAGNSRPHPPPKTLSLKVQKQQQHQQPLALDAAGGRDDRAPPAVAENGAVGIDGASSDDEFCLSRQLLLQEQRVDELIKMHEKEQQLIAAAAAEMQSGEQSKSKTKVRVLCRVRPALKDEDASTCCLTFPALPSTSSSTSSFHSSTSSLSSPISDGKTIQLMYRGRLKTFEVDDVITPNDSQEKLFEGGVRSQLVSCLDGSNVNVIAYGETGSGKTFSMQGPSSNPGIIPRAISTLLQDMEMRRSTDEYDYKLEMSAVEIYNDAARDLLSSDPNAKLDTKPNADGKMTFPGLTLVDLRSEDDSIKAVKKSQDNRTTGSTKQNDHSSRSHIIISLTVNGLNKTNNTKINAKVNLVDLAGSERIEKTGVDASRFKEAQSINKSLTCLGDVLHALLVRQAHVPFRSSKLTHLLQDSLVGKGSTLLVVQLAPVEKRASETISSLMFAQRVRAAAASSGDVLGSTSRGQQGSDGGGGSGGRTPVEPFSQRPRRPSASGFTPSERRPSVSSERRAPPPPPAPHHGSVTPATARKPTAAAAPALASGAKTPDKNEFRFGNQLSRPRSSLKLNPPLTPKK